MPAIAEIATFLAVYISYEILFRFVLYIRTVWDKSLYHMGGYTEMITHHPVFDPLLGTVAENSKVGLFKENRNISFWWFEKYGRVVHENNFHLNNVGLISRKDYSPERQGEEFRIVVLGDEMTAATTADVSWPDWLEDCLNEDAAFIRRLGRRVRVFNFGWPDAGFAQFAQVWTEKAKNFDPDLVLINVVEHGFPRVRGESPLRFQGKQYQGFPLRYRASSGEEAWLLALGHQRVDSLRDPKSTTQRPFALFLPRSLAKDPKKLWQVQAQIVGDYLAGIVWRALMTVRPIGLMALLGRRIDPLRARRIEAPPASPLADAEMVEHARKHLRTILDHHPNVLLAQNAWHSHVFPEPVEFKLSNRLIEADPTIRIADMRDYLPLDEREEEIRSWYQIPYAGEKWSNKGHRVYASAMARLIEEHLANRGMLGSTQSANGGPFT